MGGIMTTWLGDRQECNRMETRASALPGDHRTAHGERTPSPRRSTTGGGMDVVAFVQGERAPE